MDSEFDDAAVVRAGAPIPILVADLSKFDNKDWQTGYLDGLEACDHLHAGDGIISFCIGLMLGAVIAASIIHIFGFFNS